MFMRLFWIKACERLEKRLAGAIHKEETEKKEPLTTCECLYKLQEIFTTVAIVCHRYARLAVLQNGVAIILL